MAETLSAEAQAMVDEGMRLAGEYGAASLRITENRVGVKVEDAIGVFATAHNALVAHLSRMAAMAAPQGEPVARDPLIDERIVEIYGGWNSTAGASHADPIRQVERECAKRWGVSIAQGEQP